LKAVEEVSQLLFGKGDPRGLSKEAFQSLEREIPTFALDDSKDIDTQDVINAVTAADETANDALFKSRGEARRALEQGGVYLNGERMSAERSPIAAGEFLHEKYLLVRKGARSYAIVRAGK
jgi:tyrosyl-tRNA synthetase